MDSTHREELKSVVFVDFHSPVLFWGYVLLLGGDLGLAEAVCRTCMGLAYACSSHANTMQVPCKYYLHIAEITAWDLHGICMYLHGCAFANPIPRKSDSDKPPQDTFYFWICMAGYFFVWGYFFDYLPSDLRRRCDAHLKINFQPVK